MRTTFLTSLLVMASFAACSGNSDESGGGDGDGDTPGDGDGDTSSSGGSANGDGDGNGEGGSPMGGTASTGGTGSPGDGDGDPNALTSNPTDAACNLAGIWSVVTKTRTSAGGGDQVANRWYLYAISQEGEAVEVQKSWNCGVLVKNDGGIDTTVSITEAALSGLIANETHSGLQGTYSKSGEACVLDMDRIYSVIGADPTVYLPENPEDRPALASLTPLPTAADPTGAKDWDGDGKDGFAFGIVTLNGVITGVRNSVQRSFLEFDSDSNNTDYSIALDSDAFVVNNAVSIEEQVLSATSELLKTLGTLKGTDHPVTFTRLGDSYATAKLPSGDALPTSDLALCQALEVEFPYSP